MAQAVKKSTTRKKPAKKPASRATRKKQPIPTSRLARAKQRTKNFLARRPHRSFRPTRRRDYVRSLELPGYIAFTNSVWRTLWKEKKTFGGLVLLMTLATALLVGLASQDIYNQISSLLRQTSSNIFTGGWGEVTKAGLLLVTGISGNFSTQPTEAQQIYGVLILAFIWLVTVWLLRAQMAGGKPRLRDGLYNAGSPIVGTILLMLLLAIQLIPMTLAYIAYLAAASTGLMSNGLASMLVTIIAILLALLSLYLICSTFIALIVVTLPGMYPWQALRTAGDLVIGRRLRVLLRLAWLALMVVLGWALIMLPIILLTTWLQTAITQTNWIPIVPIALVLMSSLSVVFISSYIYLLYRKIVDDDSAPA